MEDTRKRNKTNIMIFSMKTIQSNFSFSFDGVTLEPVHTHKYLDVIFSSDCKWSKHADKLIEKTSKQHNVLRKVKFGKKIYDLFSANFGVFIRSMG